MLERLTADELAEALAVLQLDPDEPERADIRTGLLASVLEQLHCHAWGGESQLSPQAFLVDYAAEPPPPVDEAAEAEKAWQAQLLLMEQMERAHPAFQRAQSQES